MKHSTIIIITVMTWYVSANDMQLRQAEVNETIKHSLQQVSIGVSRVLIEEKVVEGTQLIIDSITRLASFFAQYNNLSSHDIRELHEELALFDKEIEYVIKGERANLQTQRPHELLAQGLSELFYNVYLLVVFTDKVSFYVKNIIAALLKIVSAMLTDSNINQQELATIQESLHAALATRVFL